MPLSSTQQSIDIAGIKDGIAILRNGGYRIILSVSTVNFALKSEQEQNSLVFQYQSFLNSLHFPIQIVMRSKRLDLTPYLQKVSGLAQKQQNELLKIQTEDYIDFVGKLINIANIMKKNFYVVVPYDPATIKNTSFLSKIFNKEKMVADLEIAETEFKRNSEELKQRASVVAQGLGSMSLHCVQLNTEQIIEMFYQIYNPEEANKERIAGVNNLTATYIAHTEKKEEKAGPARAAAEEEVIDNTAVVQAQQKEAMMLRQQEAAKEAEKQIVRSEPEKTSPVAEKTEEPRPPVPATTGGNQTPTIPEDKFQTTNPKSQINNNNQ